MTQQLTSRLISASRHSEEGIPAFEELFLYACPKFISANPPPYEDPELLQAYIEDPPVEPAQRHLALFLADVRAQAPVPTLRSFLKLYTSLDAKKLSNFLDADEEEMVQQLMVMKQASRSISRVDNEKGFLGGQMISTSDLDFVIDEVSPQSCFIRSDWRRSCLTRKYRSRRTWSTSPSRRWEDATQDGSSGTQNTLSASMIHFTTAHYLFQRGLLLSKRSPRELHPHPRRRKRWLGDQ